MNAENLNMGDKHLANQETLSAENRREHKRFVMLEYAKIKLADEAESSSVLVDLSLGGLRPEDRTRWISRYDVEENEAGENDSGD